MRGSLKQGGRVVLCAMLVHSLALAAGGPGSYIPGYGATKNPPRMFVIMDTSRSMRFSPDYTQAYPLLDYHHTGGGSTVLGPVCGELPFAGSSGPAAVAGVPTTVTGAYEGSPVTLDCGPGNTIVSVDMAAYGKPLSNSHPNFPTNVCGRPDVFSMHDDTTSCTVAASTTQVRPAQAPAVRGWVDVSAPFQAACVGKQSCSVMANNSLGGDPCVGVGKYAVARFSCSIDPCPQVGATQIGSKFCVAKKVMYQVVDANKTAVEFGAGGYYQLAWQKNHPAVNTSYSTKCVYDVYAANGTANPNNVAYSVYDYGTPAAAVASTNYPVTCSPEQIDPGGAGTSPLWGLCRTAQPTHQCTKSFTRQNSFKHFQNESPGCEGQRPAASSPWGWGACTPPDRLADAPPHYYNDTASGWDTGTYLGVKLSTLGTATCGLAADHFTNLDSTAANLSGGNPWAATDERSYYSGGWHDSVLPPDCKATGANGPQKCAFFNENVTMSVPAAGVVYYQDQGPGPWVLGGLPYSNVSTSGDSTVDIVASDPAIGGTCNATVTGYVGTAPWSGTCTAAKPCDLTRAAGSTTPFHNYYCPAGFTLAGSTCTSTVQGLDPSIAAANTYTFPAPASGGGTVAYTAPVGHYDSLTYQLSLTAVQAGDVSCLAPGSTLVKGSDLLTGAYPNPGLGVLSTTPNLGCGNDLTSFPGKCELVGTSPPATVGGKAIYGTVNTDLGVVTCTVDRYRTNYTASIAAADVPSCKYTRTDYTYYNNDTYCRYKRFDFNYDYNRYQYSWVNNDGDYLNSFTRSPTYPTTAVAADQYCSSSNAPNVQPTYNPLTGFTTPGPDKCPVELDPGLQGCPAGALRCKLRLNAAGATNRFRYFTDSFSGTVYANPVLSSSPQPVGYSSGGPTVTGCQLADYSAQASASPDNKPNAAYVASWGDWCQTNGTAYAPSYLDPSQLVADWYDSTGAVPGSNFTGGYWGPTPPDPSNGDVFTPAVRPLKDRGLSVGQIGPLDPLFNPVQVAPTMAAFADPNILQLFDKYDAVTNSRGLRMPDVGDITPLAGALWNVREYVADVQAAAALAGEGPACRDYSVVLVTDGDEYPSTPGAATTAVTSLTGLTPSVPVYVVGFGINSTSLDALAVAGGKAVGGHAYSANDSATLTTVLSSIVTGQLNGYYTRSKPQVTIDGKRLYVGYFQKNSAAGSLEFFGFLDAYAVGSGGSVSATPDWKLNQTLNAQLSYATPTATSTPRRLFTRHPMSYYPPVATSTIDFDEVSSCGGADGDLTTAITGGCSGAQRSQANDAIHFVRNDRPSPDEGTFTTGADRVSRLADIFHSQPAVDGPPSFTANYTAPSTYTFLGGRGAALESANPQFDPAKFTTSYNHYSALYAAKESTVFVQSNDGVLHALRDASSAPTPDWRGEERWGYVPRQLLNQIDSARTAHAWLADGSFALTDVCFGQSECENTGSNKWRSLLVASVGRAGHFLFALDVTNTTKPTWLWDYNSSSIPDGNLGETWSTPVVARVQVDNDYYKWGVFMGGGYKARTNPLDTTGSWFYVLDADPATRVGMGANDTVPLSDLAGHQAKWYVDQDNKVLDSLTSLPKDVPNNVPGRARVIRPNDGSRASRVYFGDTDGKLWTMDVTSNHIDDWAPKKLFNPFAMDAINTTGSGCRAAPITPLPDKCTNYPVGCPASKAFTAGQSLPWPSEAVGLPAIFARPYLGLDDVSQATMVYVGTGDPTMPSQTNTQNYFWAVEDGASGLNAGDTLAGTNTCRGAVRWSYYLDQAGGEKVLSDPVIIGKNIIVAVYTPPASGTCGQAGSTRLFCFDKLSGVPQACLNDTSASPIDPAISGGRARFVQVGQPGIMSDLVAVGNHLVGITSSAPDTVFGIDVVNANNPFRIKSWRRVR